MKLLLFVLSIISIFFIISCDKDEPTIVEHTVYLSVPEFNISVDVDKIGNGRINTPTDWNHVLGGTGILTITGITNPDISINIEINGDQLTTTPLTLPSGNYDFEYTVNGTSTIGHSAFLPFTASASNISVNTENQVVDLVGSTEWDLYIVTNQNLCTYSNNFITGEVIWDPDGDGPTDNDYALDMNNGYYYAYVNSSNNLPSARLLIFYDGATTDCQMASLNHATQGGKAYWVTVKLSGTQGFKLNLDGMFTTNEITIGDGGNSVPTIEEEQAAKLVGTWNLVSNGAKLGTTIRPEWEGLTVVISGNADGGAIASAGVPSDPGAEDVWPATSSWTFGESISEVVRDDGVSLYVTVNEATLDVQFTITGSGRIEGFDGLWTFSFQKSS